MRAHGRLGTLICLGVLLAGCAGAPAGNLLENPGFEEGKEPWYALSSEGWLPFEVVEAPVFEGNHSARTHAYTFPNPTSSVVSGAIQRFEYGEIRGRVPARLEGHWLAENWTTNMKRTYVQVVVGFMPKEGATEAICPGLQPTHPCQLAIILGGVSEPPLSIGNRRFVFWQTERPELSVWNVFTLPLGGLFRSMWGEDPGPFDHMLVYLEARYDKLGEDQAPKVDLDVFWDAVYLGG